HPQRDLSTIGDQETLEHRRTGPSMHVRRDEDRPGGLKPEIACSGGLARRDRRRRRGAPPGVVSGPQARRRSQSGLRRNSGWPNSTGWPFLVKISTIVPDTPAGISVNTFIASIIPTIVSGRTTVPVVTNGGASGALEL